MEQSIRIMGIDPGLRKTGWGLIESKGNALRFVAAGTIAAPAKDELSQRLVYIFNSLVDLIDEFAPDEAAVEETFVNKDARATLKLGQARGIALLAPAKAGLWTGEYAANQVKKSVVGVGHADKSQVQLMVKTLLPKAQFNSDDAADALAIAICHAHHRESLQRMMRLAV